jgi:hypothetical protein
MSAIAKKLVGTFIQDNPGVKPPLLMWAQEECRKGSLRGLIDEFVKAQAEPLEAGLVLVERVDQQGIDCVIPCRVFDHEAPSAFSAEVRLRINLSERQVQRVESAQ